ncbi:MAG TPA: bifunctional UDP-N-acetylglucosamine diphosphorylase/glucosamine-1-phosphate N-acetyltransferase GlmU [Ktedonobacterales bacterium]|nr:bifunctional UDP-N-acetylglucosamine diphosphorylase/glucosamine-1-phosphate N-acetyltransferase GlmU [Ktedonobacterales bacterium]
MVAAAVILAAGQSTRMRSRTPKPAHHVAGRPMVAHVLAAAASALRPHHAASPLATSGAGDAEDHSSHIVLVLGHESARVLDALKPFPDLPPFQVAEQRAQRGTADAVLAARPPLADAATDTILVLYGDTPLVRAETLTALLAAHAQVGGVALLTGETSDPTGYGRVTRDAAGRVTGIVEERHATAEQRRIREVNSGVYCFEAAWLWGRLPTLRPHENGELYLTDLVDLAVEEGLPVSTQRAPISETAGVNDRVQLAEAEAHLRRRILEGLMRAGVTIVDPATTFIEPSVTIGMDTIIQPFTTLRGMTAIGENCEIGPHSVVRDSTIGDGCVVLGSWLEEATLAAGARVGPMSHLRPGARLEAEANVGNFAEVKNAMIGERVQMHHFSYAGDAAIGAGTNVGAGMITCNYDGVRKHHTEVGKGVFLGSDSLLIAPVTIGDGARTGAGAVVRRDVPPGGVAVGMPARVIRHSTTDPAAHSPEGATMDGATKNQGVKEKERDG